MKPWKRDWGLTGRIWLTMFLLFLVYLAFIAVLSMLGIGLPFLVVIVFLMAFLQYFFSDRLVLWSTRARVIEPDEYPELHRMVEKCAEEAGISKPRVAIMQTPVPNAFATGRSPIHAVVAVTDSIMRLLSPRELEAVIAHEISHIRNRDVLTLTIASFVAMIAALIMNNFLFAAMFGRRDSGNAWIIVGIVAPSLSGSCREVSGLRRTAISGGPRVVRHLPHLSAGSPPTWRRGGVVAVADLLVLVLRVLPETIRERLNAERDWPGKSKETAGTSDSAREDPGSGHAR